MWRHSIVDHVTTLAESQITVLWASITWSRIPFWQVIVNSFPSICYSFIFLSWELYEKFKNFNTCYTHTHKTILIWWNLWVCATWVKLRINKKKSYLKRFFSNNYLIVTTPLSTYVFNYVNKYFQTIIATFLEIRRA